MKAKITVEFTTLRPGDKKNSTVHAGEVVEGALATWAVNNGHGRQVHDDTPVGKPAAAAAPAPAPAKAAEKKTGKRNTEKDGGAGDGGQGGGSGEGQ